MNKATVVMAVDHEPKVLRLIKHELTERGFRVVTAHGAVEALHAADAERPDIMLVDVATPGLPGSEVVRRLRERTSAPIIMLTERGGDSDKQRGFALGANDCLEKPFTGDELGKRVRAALRRVPGTWAGDHVIRYGNVAIDLNRRMVMKHGAMIPLTGTEWLALEYLAMHAGRTVPGAELAAAIWGPRTFGSVPHLRVWIFRLRQKLEDDPPHPQFIMTVRRVGYMLSTPAPSGAIKRIA